MGKIFKSITWLLVLDPELVHQKINVELMWNIIIQVNIKSQELDVKTLPIFSPLKIIVN